MRQKLRVSGHQAHISATEEDSRAPSLGRDHVSETESLTDEEADPTLGMCSEYFAGKHVNTPKRIALQKWADQVLHAVSSCSFL